MLSYMILRDIQRKEMESAALVSLEQNFYSQVSDLMVKKKNEALDSKSILSLKEYENTKKIAVSIRSKREEKIVLMALKAEGSRTDLTTEENELFKNIQELIQKSRSNFDFALKEEERPVSQANLRKIRLIAEVQPYKGLDNTIYGPFKAGEEYSLPPEEVEWLLKSRLAEPL